MNNKSLILAILLVFIIILGSSSVFAESTTDAQLADSVEIEVQGANNLAATNVDELQSSPQHNISAGATSEQIQNEINSMNDGDVLNFEQGTDTDICIYVNKSITINGNGANLIGHDNPSKANVPEYIKNSTSQGGLGIGNVAILYIVNAKNVTVNGLTITGGLNSGCSTGGAAYSNALVYAEYSNNLKFYDNVLNGSSWGLYLRFSHDCMITTNEAYNQEVTGILNFGSARTIIERNKIVNAKNHGIDVRHGTGPNVKVINNTVIGSKEGIYLMHSKGHTAAYNNIINCSISAISCCGSSDILIENNTMYKSRIGILFNSGYNNITVGTNNFNLDNLPFPPTFVYYIAEGKSDFSSPTSMMGTHSDSSSYSPVYVEYKEIPTPKKIDIDYTMILSETGTVYTVPEGASSAEIQTMIESMNENDTLKFTENAVYNDICIYADKNIKIIGNNATLIGYNNINMANVPSKVKAATADGGYAVGYRAVLYLLNNTGIVVSNLNIKAQYPGFDPNNVLPTTNEYKTAGIYLDSSKNVVITGCNIDGASWGIFMQYSGGAIVTNNNIQNSYTTGLINFGTPDSIIANNTIINAANHGIDVRHGTGPRVTVFNNTVIGSKEGIYLMHSHSHNVYNNTVLDCKIAGITCYGSGNENIFNNTINGSRIGILLGGGYYNVTIGPNSYSLDSLPFPPTFVTYLVKSENKYGSATQAVGTYSDKNIVTLVCEDIKSTNNNITMEISIVDAKNKGVALQFITVLVNGSEYTVKTDANGKATLDLSLPLGNYTAEIKYAGTDNYKATTINSTVLITDVKETTHISVENISVPYKEGELVAVLLDESNNPIAKQTLTMTIAEGIYTATTDENGKAKFALDLITGDYDADISFAGDVNNYYTESNATAKITVYEVRKATTITVIRVDGFNVTGVLKDIDGVAIGNETIYYTINDGNVSEVITNEDGTFTIAAEDNCIIEMEFVMTDQYLGTESTFTIKNVKPVRQATFIDVENQFTRYANDFSAGERGAMFYFVLKDGAGNIMTNKSAKIGINGVIYSVVTDSEGKAGLQINLAKSTAYTYAIAYLGDDEYNASFAVSKLNLVKKPITITPKKTSYTFTASAKNKYVEATLSTIKNPYDGKMYLSTGKKVTLTINGKTYTATAGKNGAIKFNIGSTTKKGTYKVTIKYAGDATYEAGTSKTITIKLS